MIDTLRFRVPINIPTYATIVEKCSKFSRSSPDEGAYKRDLYSKTLVIGAHRSTVRVSLSSNDCFYIEFSVPKYWFGHNVLLFDLKDLPLVLDDLKNRLEDEFGIKQLPECYAWRIQRLDLCYAWKLNSNEDARLALATMKPYGLPRKELVIYDSTIWNKGNTYSVKFYLKYNEFLQGDYKELTKWGHGPFAEHVLRISEGVLRFEVELRKGKLDGQFKKDVYYEDIMDTEKIQALLRLYLSTLTNNTSTTLMNLTKVSRLLNSSGTRRQAWDQWSFYRLYTSNNPVDHEMLKLLPRATFYSKVKQLKELGVGIYDQDNKLSFYFDIPSLYEVSETQIHDE
jgi:II/X family phage/plasmid replication protein